MTKTNKTLNEVSYADAVAASKEYFGGDDLAATVWVSKYALKDSYGHIFEKTPEDMHHRIAAEIERIEKKYPNPMSKEEVFALLDHFRYIIPQGGPMTGIGNNLQVASLSNCFVIGTRNHADSYGGIFRMDEEQVQLMKRRGGVGHDLSGLRPTGAPVLNSALTSTGIVPFMERYSNSTREVAQDGRRGALMLSLSIKHPDAERFIDAKTQSGKVTGANVSIKVDDEFMRAAIEGRSYKQQFPIDAEKPKTEVNIDAKKLWEKIIHNAWQSAEPGVLFWDTIIRESVPDCYADLGFNTVSTNPCGEIPLCPYDSCRLLALNLLGYVEYLEDTLQLTWKVLPEEASQEVTIVTASSSFIDLNTETGLVYAKNSGTATIKISCKEDKSVSAIIQINIKKTINPDKFFSDFVFENPVTEIVYAFGWAAGSTWEATLNGSVTKYLFEEITINQAFISTSLPTRPGTKMKYRFVVFHDTAGAGASENAAWTANYCANGAATRDSSWHFTVDSQSIYQTIPIDEIAWHAGCGTDVDLTFKDTKVPATSTEPAKVTISADGYFEMNGTKTTFKAPLKENGQIPTNENIPYTGIENYVNPQTGTYWIGNTWWSETYQHVGNYGGNLEGIAIESCVNKGNDIWKTWANSAKLIGSYILPESGLTPNAMRQHNSFSGKDCPMTMRHADRWEEFMELIKYEYAMYKYFQNFKVEFICDSPYILKNGLVKSLPAVETKIPCQIKVSCEAEDYNKTFDFTVTLGNQYTRNCNNDVPYMRG